MKRNEFDIYSNNTQNKQVTFIYLREILLFSGVKTKYSNRQLVINLIDMVVNCVTSNNNLIASGFDKRT